MLHHWIFPEVGCGTRTRHSTHPLGSTLEAMPLDCNLLEDFNDGVDRHVLLAHDLDDDKPRKFCLPAPKCVVSAMERAWEGAPTSRRIVQDVNRVTNANVLTIAEHRGVIALGLGNRKGRKDVSLKKVSSNWGRSRRRKLTVDVEA